MVVTFVVSHPVPAAISRLALESSTQLARYDALPRVPTNFAATDRKTARPRSVISPATRIRTVTIKPMMSASIEPSPPSGTKPNHCSIQSIGRLHVRDLCTRELRHSLGRDSSPNQLCLPLIHLIGSRRPPQVFVMESSDTRHLHHLTLARQLHTARPDHQHRRCELLYSLDSKTQNSRSITVNHGRGSRPSTRRVAAEAPGSPGDSRRVRRQLLSVATTIPSHRVMARQIADQSAEHKLFASDEFLDGTSFQKGHRPCGREGSMVGGPWMGKTACRYERASAAQRPR